jgi:DNA-directed RNA polymerase subunit K/omega
MLGLEVAMDEVNEVPVQNEEAPGLPSEPAPPIQSRFLFVDVAALRAKQIRRGARVRLESDEVAPLPHKPERMAMEEVRRGLVYYHLPDQSPATGRTEAGA